MSEQRFAVVFSGQLVDGANSQTVRANLARLFKVELSQVEPMFSGKRLKIKTDLDEQTARHYQSVLAKAGAVSEIVALQSVPTATPESKTTSPAAGATPAAPQAPALTIAEPGVDLIEYHAQEPANFDTSQFALAEPGADLSETQPPPAADYDTSDMDLAPPGATLSEPREFVAADFDTSAFSVDDDQ